MRLLLVSALLLTACSKQQAAPPAAPTGVFAGAGRNALCIAGQGSARRAGLIVYGEGNVNCSVSGSIEQGALIPSGDRECRIPLGFRGDTVTIGAVSAACDYYCGPGKTLGGEAFHSVPAAPPVTDLAGDPLC